VIRIMPAREQQRAFSGAPAFRKWLAANHATAKVLWLVFYKKHTGKRSISYEDAVRQALCHGWIDSIVKRMDDDRYLQKFTPRTNKAKWSRSNIDRAIELIKTGQMTEAGYAVLPARDICALKRSEMPKPARRDRTPSFLLSRLRQDQKAHAFFQSLAPSYKRNYLAWIMAAKQEKTRLRRLEKAVAMLRRGQRSLLV
jgi:uncharacterized protein YdeI (YjbR/CyaY-like superfamily)